MGGSILIAVLIAVVLLAGLTAAILGLGNSSTKDVDTAQRELRSHYLAQAGVSESVVSLIENLNANLAPPAGVGSQAAPQHVQGGAYWTRIIDNGDDTFSILSNGAADAGRTSLEVVVRKIGGGPFANAVFAGNTSNDPTYNMEFGGSGAEGDEIYGNVFSGNDVEVSGNAVVSGTISATGTITGASGQTGVTEAVPDLAAMNYALNNDFDVAGLFVGATLQVGPDGSSALQVPEENPAHIFRLNPDDRSSEWGATPKDDYFLEDPYETAQTAAGPKTAMATHITLSGAPGRPGPPGANHIYYIDGNLWLHNKHELDFKFFSGGQPISVTFVVNGNIYFSDSIYYHDPRQDGVAFIAIKDPAEPDSGNIYYGDPVFGTLEHMEAFMYAEDTFYDNNLDESGSTEVTLYGNMSAGNQVDINRDSGTQHTKLTVRFDSRIVKGSLVMPGLPPQFVGAPGFVTVSWREVAAP
jgi:hypothetical protein